ncbi:hypothetical protein JCM33374_g2194 [Metschnikowia sp. JCM 33374]|nr:hypothetical protein JCM33374_g2194 [Metschnikowia sp. JCM 33374]
MENLRTAFSLAFIADRHIAIHTDDYQQCVFALKNTIMPSLSTEDMVEIDLQQCHSYTGIVSQMVKTREGKMPQLYSVIIWKNLETLRPDLSVKSDLLRIFNEIERYTTLASTQVPRETPISLGGYSVRIPELFVIAPVMVVADKMPNLHRQIKERLWFCQSYYHSYNQEILATEIAQADILNARKLLPAVYANPEIQEYVCSLMVFTRSHRLCSLAPLTTRPSMRASEGILLLAKTLVLWANANEDSKHFVTPDFVKVAFRKIGYWLVDWETNRVFSGQGSSHQKQTEISLLTGDWYGSEWKCVEKYLGDFKAHADANSTTGFSNRIIEEVMKLVSPPL